jgi:hypothetical protein
LPLAAIGDDSLYPPETLTVVFGAEVYPLLSLFAAKLVVNVDPQDTHELPFAE